MKTIERSYFIECSSTFDYYSFGMLVPNRNGSSDGYRYGFQGQEKDDEIKGEGNSVNYKFRMHDPRVGRFFAVDPLTKDYPHYTPYSFSGNKVIHAIELEGLEEAILSQIENADYSKWYDVFLPKRFSDMLQGGRKAEALQNFKYPKERKQPGKNITGNYFGDMAVYLLGANRIIEANNGNRMAKSQLILEAPLFFLPSARTSTLYRSATKNLFKSTKGYQRYFRVQGGGSFDRVFIDDLGNVTFRKKGNISLSRGNLDHARYFQGIRGDESKIFSFEIPDWLDNMVDEYTIPQPFAKTNPLYQRGLAPKLVDPRQPGTSIEFPNVWGRWFEENIKPRSGTIID
ncbi:RHS repeat domain-containing protein [Pontimicrobium sp. MEBiC01747]